MNQGFIEVVIPISEDYELDDRHDIEDIIDAILRDQNLGGVSGGGTGMGEAIIDVDVFDQTNVGQVAELLIQFLKSANVPPETVVQCRLPFERVYTLT